MAQDLLSSLEPLLQHENKYLRVPAAKAIAELIGKKSSLATLELLDKLKPLLQDTSKDVQVATAKAIDKVVEKSPKLKTEELQKLLEKATAPIDTNHVVEVTKVGNEGEARDLLSNLPDHTTMAAVATIATTGIAALPSQTAAHLNMGFGGGGESGARAVQEVVKATGSSPHLPDGSGKGLKIAGFILAISGTALLARYLWQKYVNKEASTDALDPEPTSAQEKPMYLVQFPAYQVVPLGVEAGEIV